MWYRRCCLCVKEPFLQKQKLYRSAKFLAVGVQIPLSPPGIPFPFTCFCIYLTRYSVVLQNNQLCIQRGGLKTLPNPFMTGPDHAVKITPHPPLCILYFSMGYCLVLTPASQLLSFPIPNLELAITGPCTVQRKMVTVGGLTPYELQHFHLTKVIKYTREIRVPKDVIHMQCTKWKTVNFSNVDSYFLPVTSTDQNEINELYNYNYSPLVPGPLHPRIAGRSWQSWQSAFSAILKRKILVDCLWIYRLRWPPIRFIRTSSKNDKNGTLKKELDYRPLNAIVKENATFFD